MNDGYLAICAIGAALPVAIYLAVIWWLDRYEREPFWLVGLTFGYGAVFGIIFGILGSLALIDFFGITDRGVAAWLVAPIVEEPAKAAILLLLLLGRHFDNTTDGLIYGAATGLGFAMTENFLYFERLYDPNHPQAFEALVLMRGLFTALMHCAASAIVGAMLGFYRYRGKTKQWVIAPAIGLTLAILIHGIFNGALVHAQHTGDTEWAYLALGLVPVLGLILFIVTLVSVSREHRMLRQELLAEAAEGTFPEAHAHVLPFILKRRHHAWLAAYPDVNRKRYIHAATLLAFRRHQAERLQGRSHPAIHADITALRTEIAAMFPAERTES